MREGCGYCGCVWLFTDILKHQQLLCFSLSIIFLLIFFLSVSVFPLTILFTLSFCSSLLLFCLLSCLIFPHQNVYHGLFRCNLLNTSVHFGCCCCFCFIWRFIFRVLCADSWSSTTIACPATNLWTFCLLGESLQPGTLQDKVAEKQSAKSKATKLSSPGDPRW